VRVQGAKPPAGVQGQSPWRLIASALGAGYSPIAPGTAGSFVAVLISWPFLLGPWWLLPLATLIVAIVGTWAIAQVPATATDDPSWIVIDEVAGQWLALLGLTHPTWPGFLAAFLLFRLFDITKPGPVGWADRHHGPIPIMADDLIAGAIAALVLLGARALWPALSL
jgi:phosphatidylglycerophosphatase A